MMGRFVVAVLDAGHGTGWEVGTVREDGAILGTAVVAVSAAVNAAHTASHAGQHVISLPAWQLTFVAVVVCAAPVVAAILLWTPRRPFDDSVALASDHLRCGTRRALPGGVRNPAFMPGTHNGTWDDATLEVLLRSQRRRYPSASLNHACSDRRMTPYDGGPKQAADHL
jgi:hypothetical protein